MKAKTQRGAAPVNTVAVVEAPVSQWYARRAAATTLVVGLVTDAVLTAALSVFHPLWLAIGIGALGGLVLGLLAGLVVRAWPVLRVLWWWSMEITAGVLVVGGPVAVAHLTTWWVALLAVLVVVAPFLVVGRVRRFVWAWSWCVVVRHRLRLCFTTLVRSAAKAGGSRPAPLPLILWARPTPAGERVWLWLRAGLSLEDLDGKAALIAVPCLAKQVRLTAASERYAALVRVDIARRDPLAVRIDSPLALLIPSLRNNVADAPVSPAVPPFGLELADIEMPAAEPRNGRR
jgi:hypothetical protein